MCFILMLIFVSITLIINLISKIFTKKHVCIEENKLIYGLEKIDITKVQRINISLGEVRKNYSSPVKVWMTDCNKTFITIENPAYSLLFNLKKICKNAKVTVEELGKKLILYPIIAFVIGIIVALIVVLNS